MFDTARINGALTMNPPTTLSNLHHLVTIHIMPQRPWLLPRIYSLSNVCTQKLPMYLDMSDYIEVSVNTAQ